MRNILATKGRVGCVLPSGISSDDTTKYFFQDIVETGIAQPCLIGGAREVEQIPVFGHEKEDEPVNQPEQLAEHTVGEQRSCFIPIIPTTC